MHFAMDTSILNELSGELCQHALAKVGALYLAQTLADGKFYICPSHIYLHIVKSLVIFFISLLAQHAAYCTENSS